MLLRFLQTEFHREIEEEEEVRIVRWLGRRSGGVTCSRASNQEHRIRNKETNLKYWTSKSLQTKGSVNKAKPNLDFSKMLRQVCGLW